MRKQKVKRKKGFKRIYRKYKLKCMLAIFEKGVKEHSERLHSILSGRGALQITGRHSFEGFAEAIPISQLEPDERERLEMLAMSLGVSINLVYANMADSVSN